MSLATRLREETRALHTSAERSGLMPELLRGRLAPHRYLALLHNLHAIYAALESALRVHAQHPWIAPVFDARLHRVAALQTDLAALEAGAPAICDATRAYVQRIEALERDEPLRLLAHTYVRYLGDLNGGQLLEPIVTRLLGRADGRGTAFYRFDAPGARELAACFRAGLENLPADGAQADAVVEEACAAFARHVALFEQLSETPAA